MYPYIKFIIIMTQWLPKIDVLRIGTAQFLKENLHHACEPIAHKTHMRYLEVDEYAGTATIKLPWSPIE